MLWLVQMRDTKQSTHNPTVTLPLLLLSSMLSVPNKLGQLPPNISPLTSLPCVRSKQEKESNKPVRVSEGVSQSLHTLHHQSDQVRSVGGRGTTQPHVLQHTALSLLWIVKVSITPFPRHLRCFAQCSYTLQKRFVVCSEQPAQKILFPKHCQQHLHHI